jgi:hypothetical protein
LAEEVIATPVGAIGLGVSVPCPPTSEPDSLFRLVEVYRMSANQAITPPAAVLEERLGSSCAFVQAVLD